MGRLDKNILLILELLKAPFLVVHFSYYTLMMYSVVMLSMDADDTTLYSKCD